MKICSKCKEEKALSEFHKRPEAKDGHRADCKKCRRDLDNKRRLKKERREYCVNHSRQYRKSGKGYDSCNKYRKNNPVKYKAHKIISSAIRSGVLVKQPCEVCQSERVEAHHDDYSKPLNVRWLCQAHHKQWHAENGEGKNG